MRLIVEGWRYFPHSYGVVDQFLCLELLNRPGVELFHRDVPFVFPGIKPGLGDADIERRLSRIPVATPNQRADALVRFIAPASLRPAPAGRTLVFCTAEFGIVQPAMLDAPLASLNATPDMAVMTPSQWSRSGMIRGGADPDKVVVIPHGFDPAIFHPAEPAKRTRLRQDFGWNDDFVFLNTGAMTANKGIFELLKAFADVLREFPNARLVLKGLDSIYNSKRSLDEYKAALAEHERKRIEPRLTYIGRTLTYAQTAALYQAADVYVAPYKAEGFNIPVLEAAACGLPIICTCGGPTDEFTDPSFCLRVPSVLRPTQVDGVPGAHLLEPDMSQFTAMMRKLIMDSAFADACRDAGPPFVSAQFTWKHAADQLLQVLSDPHALCWRARNSAVSFSHTKEIDPDVIYRAGVSALEANHAAEALRHFHHAMLLKPYEPSYVSAVGEAYRALGRPTDAAAAFRAAIARTPGFSTAHNALGEVLLDNGNAADSLDAFHAAITARPGYERAHMNLGRALHVLKRSTEAEGPLKEAVRLNPKYAIAHNNLGAVYQSQGKSIEAAESFRAAIAVRPDYPEAHFNLGEALRAAGNLVAAAAELQKAIRLRPNYARAHAQLGQTVFDAGQVAASVQFFQAALSHNANDNATRLRLGEALRLLNRLPEAQAVFDQAIRAEPDSAEAFAHHFRVRQEVCDWSDRERDEQRLWKDARQEIQSNRASSLHPLHAMSLALTGLQQLQIAQSHAREYEKVGERHRTAPAELRVDGGRIKVGYLSRDFYDHPVGHLIQQLFGLHDRKRIEAHAFSFGPNDSSTYRRRIETDCEHFHDVSNLSLTELDRRIRADGIQILVDLMGYTGMARTACLALRPAPIQVSWLGFAGTMGASFIDYLIADSVVAPPGSEEDFSEKLVRLPHSFMITDNQQPISSRPSRQQQGLPDNAFVFCCFNNAPKIEPRIFDIWMQVLREVPGSVAWLSVRNETAQQNLRREAAARGIDGASLIFSTHVKSKADHLARLGLADLFLDTHYYNAHATTADALWAGLPVLTCPGDTFASRVAASVVTAAALPELVMPDLDRYKAEAIRLARIPKLLDTFRHRLVSARSTAPLFDTPKFVRDLERAYEGMWSAKTE